MISYFYYYETNHGGNRLSILPKKQYKINLKDSTIFEPIFWADIDPKQSYLFDMPTMGEIDEIHYSKEVEAIRYDIKIIPITIQYQKYDDVLVNKMMESIIDDSEWTKWFDEYNEKCTIKSPTYNYQENREYCLILSDGETIITQATSTFNEAYIVVEL